MAKIVVINNVFDLKDNNSYECNEKKSIKDFLKENKIDDRDYSCCVEIYDPETDTTYFEPIEDDDDNINMSIVVNGECKDLDYVINPNDLIVIEILPASGMTEQQKNGWGGIGIGAMLLAIGIAGIVTGGIGVAAGLSLGASIGAYSAILGFGILGAAMGIGAIVMGAVALDNASSNNKTIKDDSGEKNPSISGSQNQPLSENAFPLVIGDVSATPFIVGSPYIEFERSPTFDKSWTGYNQKMYLLLAVGYAPLLVKDIKLDELKIAQNPKNVLNGILSLDYGNDEIGATWRNNKPKFEISQFGLNRTIYPYTVKQKKVGSTLLYCYDNEYVEIEKAGKNGKAITWQGGSFPTGMRNMPIYFSESVPYKIAVGIKFPGGLYETYSTDGGSNIYKKLPMNLVVQWRPMYKMVSDDEGVENLVTPETYSSVEGYNLKRYSKWRNFDSSSIVPKFRYKTASGTSVYKYKIYYFEDSTGKKTARTTKVGKEEYYFSNDITSTYYTTNNIDSSEYSNILNNAKGYTSTNECRKYTKSECKQLFVDAYLNAKKISPFISFIVGPNGKAYDCVGYEKATKTAAKSWANKYYVTYYDNQDDTFFANHVNNVNDYSGASNVTDPKVEVQSNLGLSEGTDTDCNPVWNGVDVFGFGKYSCGDKAYEINSFSPEVNSNVYRDNIKFTDIENAKDEMDFELTATLDQETILDLINRNPKSIELNGNNGNTVTPFSDKTSCVLDSIQVRVIRLTPCYVDKTKDSVSHTYSDSVQWSYLKTYCINKQKLIEDIDYVQDGKHFPKINCNLDSYNATGTKSVVTPNGTETLNVPEVMEAEGCKKWNEWNISDYYSTPLDEVDQNNLVTIGVEVTPDKLGYITNSLDKINLTAKAITPAYASQKLSEGKGFIRYVKKLQEKYFFCDRYDSDDDILSISNGTYSITNTNLEWQFASEEVNTEVYENILSSVLINIGTKDGAEYSYYIKDKDWDKCFFPKKIESKQTIELVTDSNGNPIIEDPATKAAKFEKVRYGNDWFDYIKKEMALNTITYTDSESGTLIGNRWEATKSFVDTFCGQNAIIQALGFMTGKSLGKEAYSFSSYNTDKLLRLWRVKDETYIYYNTDLDAVASDDDWIYVYNTAKNPEEDSKVTFDEESPVEINFSVPEYEEWTWYYSFRKIANDFNPLALQEAIEYTDNIDIGGANGPLKYKCNMYVYQQQKVVNYLATILTAGRAYWFYDEKGRYEIHNDKPLKNPVMLITDEDCISTSCTRSFAKQIAGYHITFPDENNSFQSGEIYVLREGQTRTHHTRDIVDLNLTGVTNGAQAWALGAYLLGQSITQRESWTKKLNNLGYALTIGSLIETQSAALQIGTDHSGRIIRLIDDNDYIYGFITDNTYKYRSVYDDDGKNVQGCSIMQPLQATDSRIVTVRFANQTQQNTGITVGNVTYKNVYGDTNLVLFEKKIAKATHKQGNQNEDVDTNTTSLTEFEPKLGDVIAFGNVGSITSKAVVYNIAYDEKNHVTIQLYPYFDSLYTSGSKLPVYESNITRKPITDNIPTTNADTYSLVTDKTKELEASVDEKIAGIDVTTFTITPENTLIPCTSKGVIKDPTHIFSITANYVKNKTVITEDVVFSATMNDETIGTWNKNVLSFGVEKITSDNNEILITVLDGEITKSCKAVISKSYAGTDGGYQNYVFYVGNFNMSKQELLEVDWTDEPGIVPENKCLYMATKWIQGE